MIRKVKDLEIGKKFYLDGEIYRVTKFPTRKTVCGDNVRMRSGKPSMVKVSIKDAEALS